MTNNFAVYTTALGRGPYLDLIAWGGSQCALEPGH